MTERQKQSGKRGEIMSIFLGSHLELAIKAEFECDRNDANLRIDRKADKLAPQSGVQSYH